MNPFYGDWSAWETSEVKPLGRGNLLQRVDRESLSDRTRPRWVYGWSNVVPVEGLRGFQTDRTTHDAMNAYARNSPYRPKLRKLPRVDD